MKVFVDTSAYLALEIKNDKNHLLAKRHFNFLKKKRALFFTNDCVLVETYTRLIYDIHFQAAKKFHKYVSELLSKAQLTLLEVDDKDRELAWIELERYSDHKLSFTDAAIIANFRAYKVDEIFTFDRHFKACGLPTNL